MYTLKDTLQFPQRLQPKKCGIHSKRICFLEDPFKNAFLFLRGLKKIFNCIFTDEW